MSLAINTNKIVSVLIGGQWHDVNTDHGFQVDAYEYDVDLEPAPLYSNGIGFRFVPADDWREGREPLGSIVGPMSAIQAVRVRP